MSDDVDFSQLTDEELEEQLKAKFDAMDNNPEMQAFLNSHKTIYKNEVPYVFNREEFRRITKENIENDHFFEEWAQRAFPELSESIIK